MAKYVLFVCVLFNAWLAGAQTAYVAAPAGLKLRKTADAKGVVAKTLVYASAVTKIADTKPKVAHKIKEAEGFYLNGYWQKVVAGKDTGYVFDAFLISVKPYDTIELDTYYDDTTRNSCMPFDVYFLNTRFKAFGEPFDVIKYTGEDSIYYNYDSNINSPYCQKGFSQKFDKGKISMSYSSGEGGAGMSVTLSGYSFNYVYALALSTTHVANDKITITYANKVVQIEPADGGAGCYSTIKVVGNTIVWDFGCGC